MQSSVVSFSSLLPLHNDDHSAFLQEDLQNRTTVPTTARRSRRRHRHNPFLRGIGILRLSLPSLIPPPPPPPEYLYSELSDSDVARLPFPWSSSSDGQGGKKGGIVSRKVSKRVFVSVTLVMMVAMAMLLVTMPVSFERLLREMRR